jgi:hypothetical protein
MWSILDVIILGSVLCMFVLRIRDDVPEQKSDVRYRKTQNRARRFQQD